VDEVRIPRAGDPFTSVEGANHPEEKREVCFHCLDTGWVMLTAENDYGELEDFFVLCRRCKDNGRRS